MTLLEPGQVKLEPLVVAVALAVAELRAEARRPEWQLVAESIWVVLLPS